QRMKEVARRIVDRLGPTDLMSVVFTRDNRGSQGFTSDRARLLAAIDTFTVGFRDMGGGDRASGAAMDDLWYLYSVGVLERAVDYLAWVPDRRKAIISLGQGVPFDLETAVTAVKADTASAGDLSAAARRSAQELHMRIKDQMSDVFDRAKRANVNIYTVDVCGLRVEVPAAPRVPAPGAIQPPPPPCQPGFAIDYLVQVAAATGGRPIVNTNDFEPGLTQLFAENASYYLLGYQSTNPAHDGKFRKLDVNVNRPDVEVRTRTGYDAPRDESAGPAATGGLPLHNER